MLRGEEKVMRFVVCEMHPLTVCFNVRAQSLMQPGAERMGRELNHFNFRATHTALAFIKVTLVQL